MAIEPASVDWSSARRASYLVRQTFRYEYPEPIRDLSHRLVVIPPERFGDQRRLWHDVSIRGDRGSNHCGRRARARRWRLPGLRPRDAGVVPHVWAPLAIRVRPPPGPGRHARLGRGDFADE